MVVETQLQGKVDSPIETIRYTIELTNLIDSRNLVLFRRRRSAIRLELAWMTAGEQELWSERITRYVNQCGCKHGAAFLVAACVVLTMYLMLYGVRPFGIWYLLIGPLLLFVSSGIGKALGIYWSRIQLRWVTKRLIGMSATRERLAHAVTSHMIAPVECRRNG